MAKFMLSLRETNFQLLTIEAQERGITVQELIRAVIIPDWVKLAAAKNGEANSGPSNSYVREQVIQPIGGIRKFGNNYPRQSLG